jgi:alpha-1,3/alpha-1,6-mannosyltransferase
VRIVFLHPDLGIGGAERLVVDAAAYLAAQGHRVAILTAHHDPARAFPETADGTLDVRVRGAGLPAQVFGRLRAPCAIVRMAWLAVALRALRPRPDVVVCDLVAHVIPLARRAAGAPVILYCHHPDRFVAPARGGLYRWYRKPIDSLETFATRRAARVLVNSRYTAARFRDAFPALAGTALDIVHPGVDLLPTPDLDPDAAGVPVTILCLARFDPRKNLGLAVEALAALRTRLPAPTFARVRLVVAGGCDERLREQRETVAALERQAQALGLADRVGLVRSPTEPDRIALLAACRCVLHTPADEHFGYVPLEAMAAGRPVVAARTGGPAETVVDGETGLLCESNPDAVADALARLVGDPPYAARLGRGGRRRAAEHFSCGAFGLRFAALLRDVTSSVRGPGTA